MCVCATDTFHCERVIHEKRRQSEGKGKLFISDLGGICIDESLFVAAVVRYRSAMLAKEFPFVQYSIRKLSNYLDRLMHHINFRHWSVIEMYVICYTVG